MPITHRNMLLRFFKDMLKILEYHEIPDDVRKEIEDVRNIFRKTWSDIETQAASYVDTDDEVEGEASAERFESYAPHRLCEVIRHEGGKWVLYSRDGTRVLGRYDTKKEALKRERQVQFFKRQREAGAGNVDALIASFNDWAEGSVTKCIEVLSDKPGVTEPEALCAWLKDQAQGTAWRHEKRS